MKRINAVFKYRLMNIPKSFRKFEWIRNTNDLGIFLTEFVIFGNLLGILINDLGIFVNEFQICGRGSITMITFMGGCTNYPLVKQQLKLEDRSVNVDRK